MAKKILVTGGAGFIGSNFIEYVLEKDRSIRTTRMYKSTHSAIYYHYRW